MTRRARPCRKLESAASPRAAGPARISPSASAARGQSSRQSSNRVAPRSRAASQALTPRKSGGTLASTTSGRGPESATGSALQAKVRWFHSRVSALLRGVAWSHTRSMTMAPSRSVARRTPA